jgi:sporulation protein YtfJ
MAEMPLSDVIKTSLENIKNVLDANTVIGDPITVLEDTAIVPISKISVGFASAGAEYNGKKEIKSKNFGGGGGTGVTLTPICFIVVNRSGEIKMLNVESNSGYSGNEGLAGIVNAVDELINKAPGMVEKVKDMFAKDGANKETKE